MAKDNPEKQKVESYISDETVGIKKAYKTEGFPNTKYQDIAVASTVKPYNENGVHIGLAGAVTIKHSELLDPTQTNISIGSQECSNINLCVPTVSVPTATKELADTYKNGTKVTSEDEKAAETVRNLADQITNLTDSKFNSTVTVDERKFRKAQEGTDDIIGYPNLDTSVQAPLTTQESVPCRPETEAIIPNLAREQLESSPEMENMLKQLEDLLNTNTIPDEDVEPADKSSITTREVNGHGLFDWLSTATLNQVEHGINRTLWTKAEAREIYAGSLGQMMQHAVEFALNKEQAKWQSLLVRNQMIQANVQSLLAKAELIMMPTKVRLAYAQLQTQLKQLDLLNYQIEVEKQKIPQVIAQTDQIREQTALICQQRKLAIEQLAQSELDRKLKQEQIIQAQQQSKLTSAQAESALKDLKIKDAQVLQMAAQLKLQAQQLLKEKEQIALVKAQVASTYASITAQMEQIKTMKAQYSDTINGEPIGGILGAQMKVNKAQAIGFERQAFNNFISQLQSGWTTKKTADMATLSPNSFTALGIDRALNWYAQKYFNMPNDIFELPEDYTDFLSDDDMDGKTNADPSKQTIKK